MRIYPILKNTNVFSHPVNRSISFIIFLFTLLAPAYGAKQGAQDNGAKEIFTAALFDLDLKQLMEVKISIASKTPEVKHKTAGTVYVVTEEDIARYGWRDLREILAFVPAFSTIRSFDWFNVSLRGGGASMLKLLIDGREVQNLIADEAVIQDSFPAHRIKRLEILMGSHSTLYGSNAADGVINIITKQGSEFQDDRKEVQILRGDVNTQQFSAVMRSNFEGGHMGFSAATFESDYNWKELTDFAQDNDLWSRRDTGSIPDYSNPVSAPYRSYSLGFFTEYNGAFFGTNIWEDSGPQGYNEVFAYSGERRSIRKFDQWFGGTEFNIGQIKGTVEYIYTDEEDLFLEPDWNGSLEPTRHHVKTEARTEVGEHQLVFGYDGYAQKTIFRNDAVGSGGDGLIRLFPNSKIHTIKTTKHSLFIHDSFDITENSLTAVAGLRYEAYKDVEKEFIPRLGLVYTPGNQSSFRAIYGGGFRAPNGFDIVRAQNAGNDTLDPIKSKMFELGYTQSASGSDWLVYNNFSIYFYEIDGNYILRLVPGGGGGPGIFEIEPDDSSKSSGIENMLKFEYQQFSGFLSARYSMPDKVNVAGKNIVKDIPKYKIKLGLSYDFTHLMRGSLFIDHWAAVKTEANIVDVVGTEVVEISDWTTIDFNLLFGEYKWGQGKLKVSLYGENITDVEYFHPLGGASPYQVMQPPRNFRLTADLKF